MQNTTADLPITIRPRKASPERRTEGGLTINNQRTREAKVDSNRKDGIDDDDGSVEG